MNNIRFILIIILSILLTASVNATELYQLTVNAIQQQIDLKDKQHQADSNIERRKSLILTAEESKIISNDGSALDNFGTSVSLSGNRALIGAPWDSDNGTHSGSAYVFEFNGSIWEQTAKLLASDGFTDDEFGYSASLSGNRVLIGAYQDDDIGFNSGSAYIFEFDGNDWNQTAKLTADNGSIGGKFGYSVSLSGNRVLIGAYADDNYGSAYVFEFDGNDWNQTAKLTAGDGSTGDDFGYSVSLSGDRALIGAYRDDAPRAQSGSAYVFDLGVNGWSETAKLIASDGAATDQFGVSVSLSGDRALIGAFGDDDENGFYSGSAYVFDYGGNVWSETAKLIAFGGDWPANNEEFGYAVSLSGGQALIGAREGDIGDSDHTGLAYLFKFDGNGWSETAKINASDGADGDRFGVSVSMSGGRTLIGANRDYDNGAYSGSAYVFAFDFIFENGFD